MKLSSSSGLIRGARKIQFSIHGPPISGSESLFVVGEPGSLGNWQPARGLKMMWQGDGKIWRGEADCPFSANRFEYKYVVINNQTKSATWEQGPNRVWSCEFSTISDYWDESSTAISNYTNFGRIDLVSTIQTLKKNPSERNRRYEKRF